MAGTDAKKKQKEYIAITALVLVALFIGMSRFKKGEADDEVFSRKNFKEQWKEVEILERNIPAEQQGVSYDADPEKTPFKSPMEEKKKDIDVATEDVSLPSMTFQGMVWGSTRPQVIINNKVYDVNDVIYTGADLGEEAFPVKITDVKREGIYLRYKGKDFLVRPK